MDSVDDAAGWFTSNSHKAQIAADEENFLDRSATRFLYSTETVVFGWRRHPTKEGNSVAFTHPDNLHAAFAAAFQASDVATLVDLYEDGAIQIQPDGTTVTGKDALAGAFTRLLALGLTMQGDPQEAIVAGDLALTSTHYPSDTDEPDGARTVATAEVSRRQADCSWRVVIDVPAFA